MNYIQIDTTKTDICDYQFILNNKARFHCSSTLVQMPTGQAIKPNQAKKKLRAVQKQSIIINSVLFTSVLEDSNSSIKRT